MKGRKLMWNMVPTLSLVYIHTYKEKTGRLYPRTLRVPGWTVMHDLILFSISYTFDIDIHAMMAKCSWTQKKRTNSAFFKKRFFKLIVDAVDFLSRGPSPVAAKPIRHGLFLSCLLQSDQFTAYSYRLCVETGDAIGKVKAILLVGETKCCPFVWRRFKSLILAKVI